MTEELEPRHENCKTCKLYQKATAPFSNAYGKENEPGVCDLYIVTGKLYEHELKFLGDEAGQWVMNQVRQSGLSYIVDSAVRCNSNKPTAAQKKLCAEGFLQPNLSQCRPKVIWCLGLDAAQMVLGSSLGLSALQKAGIMEGPYGIPTIVTDHPSNHSSFKEEQFRGQDLRPVYSQAWYHIDYILRRGWRPSKLRNYECTANVETALEWAHMIAMDTAWFSFDTEFGKQERYNVSHPTTELLCWGVGYGTGRDNIIVKVFDARDWTMTERYKVLCSLLNQVSIVTTFGKIDLMVMWFTTRYNAFTRGINGIHKMYDTGQIRWHQDQEQFDNGLEEQCVEVYGAERWKYKTDEQLNKIKAERTVPLADGLEDYDYRHLDRDFCNEYQGWDAYHQARLWIEKYAHPDNLAQLKPEFDTLAYQRTQAITKVVCWIERTGLIVDTYYLEIYKESLEKKMAILDKWIQAHPFVERMRITEHPDKPLRPDLDKDGNQKVDRYGVPKMLKAEMMVKDEFNPASSVQMRNLFTLLGIEAVRKSDKTKMPKCDKLELVRQAGGSMLDEFERTGQQNFFFAILKYRGLSKQLSSFVAPFIQYAVRFLDGEADEMRVHTNFKMNKVLSGSEAGTDADVEGGVDSMRFSTADPCISNIAKNKVLRKAFPAPPGKVFFEVDQATVEPRVLAYDANCQALIEIFELKESEPDNPDADLYRIGWRNFERSQGNTNYTSAQVPQEIRDNWAKPLILGSFYESSAIGIHQRNNVPLEIAQAFLDTFWQNFPELLAYNAEIRRRVFEGEFVESSAGHRALFRLRGNYSYDHDKHKELPLKKILAILKIQDGPDSDAEMIRKAENFVTQAKAKAITDVLMIELYEYMEEYGDKYAWLPDLDLNNTVHDSVWCYVREGREQELFVLLRKIARNIKLLEKWGITFHNTTAKRILLDLEAKAGPTLGELEKIKLPSKNSILNIPGLVGVR